MIQITNADESRDNYTKLSRELSPPNPVPVASSGVKNLSPAQNVCFAPSYVLKSTVNKTTEARNEKVRKYAANSSLVNLSKCTSERNIHHQLACITDKSMSVASSHSNLGGGSKIGNKTKHGSRLGDMLGLSQIDQNRRTSPLNGTSLLDWKLPELCHVPTPHELTGRTFDNMPQNVRPKYKSNIAKR